MMIGWKVNVMDLKFGASFFEQTSNNLRQFIL